MKKIVAITACPVGIAHTYMAAEKLVEVGSTFDVEVQVETHGSIGVENVLTQTDIDEAIGVIVAADTQIDLTRFIGKRVLVVSVQAGIHQAHECIEQILSQKVPVYEEPKSKQRKEQEISISESGTKIYKSLMNGVSYMVPFVVTGGLLIAIALSLGGVAGPTGVIVPEGTIWSTILSIGVIAIGLMVPILSAYIAQSIADRPGLVPGFIGGMLAVNGTLYGSDVNAGFLGGIVTGFLAGIVVLALKKIPVPKVVQAIMPIIVIPILSSLIVGFSFIYIIGTPLGMLFEQLTQFLVGMQSGSQVILALILGAMIAVDMGGPFNKVAFLFGAGLIAEGNYTIMGPIAVAICIPPLALGVATAILPKRFSMAEKETGKAAIAMGMFGITEGAIPFAATDPFRVIPSIVVGSMVGSVIAMVSGVTNRVAHGGPIVALLGAVDNIAMFFIAVAVGVVVTVIMLYFLKHPIIAEQRNEEQPMIQPKKEYVQSEDEAFVHPKAIVLLKDVSSKYEVIDVLTERLVQVGAVTSKKELQAAVLQREEQSTTGIGLEVAIPHGKSSAVQNPTVAFARVSDGVDWDALDETKAKLIFLLAVPKENVNDVHLKMLQRLSRRLMNESFREQLLAAVDETAIQQLLETV
ncbi:MAG: fructose-specific PTS transporter subunit EIIC [Culicoidibacterales bacterium]